MLQPLAEVTRDEEGRTADWALRCARQHTRKPNTHQILVGVFASAATILSTRGPQRGDWATAVGLQRAYSKLIQPPSRMANSL